jgi:hypothetical protein
MPHVLEEPDVLEEDSVVSPTCDELHALPTAPRERTPVMTFLRRLITPVPKLRMRRQDCCVARAPQVETALDVLAREHPDIHLRLMAGMV